MKFSAVEAIFLITVLPLSSSVLVQVLNFKTICLQNTVLYECIVADGFLLWTVRQSSSTTYLFTYSYTIHSGTANYTKGLGPSTISAQLIFRNSTFISSILTITNVTSLRGDVIIECNQEMESLHENILNTDFLDNSLPISLIITQYEKRDNTFNFTIHWSSSSRVDVNQYFVVNINSVNSPTPEVQTLSEPSDLFTLKNNTEYAINISLCNQASNFHIGRGPLLGNIQAVFLHSYIVNISGATGALLMDVSSNRSVIMYCNNNGEWDWSALHLLFDTTIVIDNCTVTDIGAITHDVEESCNVTTVNQVTGITYPVAVVIGTVSCIFGIFIGIVGTCSGLFLKSKKQKFCYKRNPLQSTNVPVNEDVTTELKIQVSPNVAYQDVHRQF